MISEGRRHRTVIAVIGLAIPRAPASCWRKSPAERSQSSALTLRQFSTSAYCVQAELPYSKSSSGGDRPVASHRQLGENTDLLWSPEQKLQKWSGCLLTRQRTCFTSISHVQLKKSPLKVFGKGKVLQKNTWKAIGRIVYTEPPCHIRQSDGSSKFLFKSPPLFQSLSVDSIPDRHVK